MFISEYKGWKIYKDVSAKYYARSDDKDSRPGMLSPFVITSGQCMGRGRTIQSVKDEIDKRSKND